MQEYQEKFGTDDIYAKYSADELTLLGKYRANHAGQVEQALQDFENAIKQNPKSLEAFLLYTRVGVRTFERGKNLEKVVHITVIVADAPEESTGASSRVGVIIPPEPDPPADPCDTGTVLFDQDVTFKYKQKADAHAGGKSF